MHKTIFTTISTILLTLIFCTTCFAHQPRIVDSSFTEVKNPTISQAFYGELNGQPHIYEFNSEEEFRLYLGILVPYLPNIDKDISAQVFELTSQEKKTLFYLKAEKSDWELHFEKFAGDYYYSGPDLKNEAYTGELPQGIKMNPGTYQVKVYSPDNVGKYVFVIGTIEDFPLHEIFKSLITLPQLKTEFFEKPIHTAFFNYIGLISFGFIIIVIVLILYLIWLIRRIKNKNEKTKPKRKKRKNSSKKK